jgi:hypothetical protein
MSRQRDDVGCVVQSPNHHLQLAEGASSFGDAFFQVVRPGFKLVRRQNDEERPRVQYLSKDDLGFGWLTLCNQFWVGNYLAPPCGFGFACMGSAGHVKCQRDGVWFSLSVPGCIEEDSYQVIDETV